MQYFRRIALHAAHEKIAPCSLSITDNKCLLFLFFQEKKQRQQNKNKGAGVNEVFAAENIGDDDL